MNLAAAELLNREQMKQIMGGFAWGSGSGASGPPPILRCTGTCNSGNGSECDTDGTGDSSGCGCSQITINGQTSTDYFCG